MPTCRDCIYVDICDYTAGTTETACGHFKDSSKFVELPCKVDDEFYVLCEKSTIFKYTVSHIKVFLCSVSICNVDITLLCREQKHSFTISKDVFISALGKTIFFTREAAEQALKLKERERTA